ncbi:MAG TPA: hypothetical protein PK435_15595 [Thermoanaerobaculaceae bacterium]|nr:hypothetical protein [Thermoanaerobaculaceae bacterium]
MKSPASRLRLERLKDKLARHLPPPQDILRASVFTRRRRCGGAGCHCAKGPGHATTYLAVCFPGGSTEQVSLPAELVPEARRHVAVYHRWWRIIDRISAINRELFRRRWIEPSKPRAARRRA